MKERDWTFFISDMIQYCEQVETLTLNLNSCEFVENDLIYTSTLWYLRLIGEAATNVPCNIRKANPQIEWPQIIGMRNHLTHAYLLYDNAIIWDTIKNDVPKLSVSLREFMKQIY